MRHVDVDVVSRRFKSFFNFAFTMLLLDGNSISCWNTRRSYFRCWGRTVGGKQTDIIALLIAAWIVITHILLDNLIAGAKLAKL